MTGGNTLGTAAGQKVLDDGEWHLGAEVLSAMARAVPPQHALNRMERIRKRAHRRRYGEDAEVPELRGDRSIAARIASGQRNIAWDAFSRRVKDGAWVVMADGPLGKGAWRRKDWKIRDTRAGRVSITALAEQVHISPERLRRLVILGAVPFTRVGPAMYLYPPFIEKAEALARQALAESDLRRAESLQQAHAVSRAARSAAS